MFQRAHGSGQLDFYGFSMMAESMEGELLCYFNGLYNRSLWLISG